MVRPSRLRRWLPAVALLVPALLAVTAGAAPEEASGRIDFQVRLEPADLAPGGEGVLVVTSVIGHELHLYADGSEGLTWKPVPAEGVTYRVPKADGMTWADYEQTPGEVTWTKPTLRPIPGFPNAPPDPVWEVGHDFEIRVPVSLAPDAAPDTSIGLVLAYSGCDEANCYDRVKEHGAAVLLGASPPAPGHFQHPLPVSDAAASVSLEVKEGAEGDYVAVVTFTPAFGFHLYQPDSEGEPVEVEPLPDVGITWGAWDYPAFGGTITAPYAVELPFERSEDAIRIRVSVTWQGCDDAGTCERPNTTVSSAMWVAGTAGAEPGPAPGPGVEPTPMVAPGPGPGPGPGQPVLPAPAEPPEVADGEKVLTEPSKDLPFPVVHGDDLDQPRTDDDWVVGSAGSVAAVKPGSELAKKWESSWLLFLGTVFVLGIGLAFTPCVLPIIPLTISVIGGGNPDVSRSRMTLLLSVYVLGLALTYGAAGAASGALGEAIDMEAAFQNPLVLWGIAIVFLVMAAGMIGIFELQPPAWMERMRGGAQRKSGTIIGSFLLGILAALVASPCTGPFVVGMLTFVAAAGDPFLGFVLFGTLGLGMGAVFFAAGSLNLLARPGPWMVWVRYAFGVILFGVALHLVANAGQLDIIEGGRLDDVILLFAVGFAAALIAWWAVARHLHRKEGERLEVARMRGAILSICLILTTGLVAWVNRPAGEGPGGWVKLRDVAHLQEEVGKAKKAGRPVVVDVWATWCTYCKAYDHVIADDAYLDDAFGDLVRLKIDVEDDAREDLRAAVGIPAKGQPRMVFFDEKGRIRRAADIKQWHSDDSAAELRKRVDFVLWRQSGESAGLPR